MHRRVYYTSRYECGSGKQWNYVFSHKRKESSTVVVFDIGSAMNMDKLLTAMGYKKVEPNEYNHIVRGFERVG